MRMSANKRIGLPSPAHTVFRVLVSTIILSLLFSGEARSERADPKKILSFAEAWVRPQDYAWTRESLTTVGNDTEPGLGMRDSGRFRIEYIKHEEESAVLDVWVLVYRFEAQLKGERPIRRLSPLEGKRLPLAWLHWALGFSSDLASTKQIKKIDRQQANQVLELIDFRGFVPSKSPEVGEEWKFNVVPDRGPQYACREKLDRSFVCKGKKQEDDETKYRVEFQDTFQVTPVLKGCSPEVRERSGVYWLNLPSGFIEAATWEETVFETLGGSKEVETHYTVSLVRQETTTPRRRKGRRSKKAKEAEFLPPR